MRIIQRKFYHFETPLSLDSIKKNTLLPQSRTVARSSDTQQTLEALARMEIRVQSRTVVIMSVLAALTESPEAKYLRGGEGLVQFWFCRPERKEKNEETKKKEDEKPTRTAIIIPVVCKKFRLFSSMLRKYGPKTTRRFITELLKVETIGALLDSGLDEQAKETKKKADEASARATLAWHTFSLAESVEQRPKKQPARRRVRK